MRLGISGGLVILIFITAYTRFLLHFTSYFVYYYSTVMLTASTSRSTFGAQ